MEGKCVHNIFIIEDDVKLREALSVLLKNYNYNSSFSDDFENIISIAIKSEADLILLDINLPYFDGYFICREIRKLSEVPIIIVTSRNNDMDELMSMNLGADDFITKPYNTQILLARISAILKRSGQNNGFKKIVHGGVELNTSKSVMTYNNCDVELTKNEIRILDLLFRNIGAIVSRDELMNELWQSDEFVDDNTLTVNINRVRKKLDGLGATDFIKTKRGQGYII